MLCAPYFKLLYYLLYIKDKHLEFNSSSIITMHAGELKLFILYCNPYQIPEGTTCELVNPFIRT